MSYCCLVSIIHVIILHRSLRGARIPFLKEIDARFNNRHVAARETWIDNKVHLLAAESFNFSLMSKCSVALIIKNFSINLIPICTTNTKQLIVSQPYHCPKNVGNNY